MKNIWNALKKVNAVLLVLIVLLSQAAWAIAPSSSAVDRDGGTRLRAEQVERIDAFVTEQMARHRLPGLALALVERDQLVFMKGYGKADGSGRAVTPQTPFLLASASKPLTAAAIMQLVEQGKIELDAPVQRYLSEFRLADAAASGQITIRHLLLHTSGLPATACDTRIGAQTLAEYVAELQTVELSGPVGARHLYCSGNYNVLGRVIEVVSGRSFGEYMQERVFAPLGMDHAFTSEPAAREAGLAQGYQWLFGLQVPTRHAYNPSQLSSGSMIASAEDMSHFLITQLNDGRYGEAVLLSPDSVAAMQSAGTARARDGGYGFGWVVAPLGGVPAVWHDGVNANFHSLLLMQPRTGRGAVVLMNSFGIVPYESAYREIEEGIARLLADLEPAAPGRSLGTLYLLIDIVLALGLSLALVPLIRIGRWRRWLLERRRAGDLPLARVMLRSVLEIAFGLAFLAFVRAAIVTGLGAQSWSEVLAAFPDFVSWIWLFALTVLLSGVIRMAMIWQARRSLRDGQPAPESGKSRLAEKPGIQ